jgi:hypothetical protein
LTSSPCWEAESSSVEALLARYARGVGQPAPVSGEVERILGRPARTYARWAADHAAAFRN